METHPPRVCSSNVGFASASLVLGVCVGGLTRALSGGWFVEQASRNKSFSSPRHPGLKGSSDACQILLPRAQGAPCSCSISTAQGQTNGQAAAQEPNQRQAAKDIKKTKNHQSPSEPHQLWCSIGWSSIAFRPTGRPVIATPYHTVPLGHLSHTMVRGCWSTTPMVCGSARSAMIGRLEE